MDINLDLRGPHGIVLRMRAITGRALKLGILLAILAGLGGCSFVEQQRHQLLLNRLDAHVDAAMRDPRGAKDIHIIPLPPLDDANARWAILRAIKTARMNEFWHHTRVSRPKLLTVIERLDASKGRDFDTVQGCLTILDLLEEVTPTARSYFSFATIHEAQDNGNFPKLIQRIPPPAPN